MKYRATPVEIDAFKITAVNGDGSTVTLDDGRTIACASADEPQEGDYLVFWPDGEETVYPADEFAERFSQVTVGDAKEAA